MTPEEIKLAEAKGMLVQSQLDLLQMRNEKEAANRDLTHLRAESLRLVSANDALEKERDGLREERDELRGLVYTKSGDTECTWANLATSRGMELDGLRRAYTQAWERKAYEGQIESLRAQLSTAQAAEARLRALLDESVALNNDKRQWDSRPEVKIAWVNAQIDLHKRIAALATPPTAATAGATK